MFRCKSDLSRWNGFKVTAFQNFHYFERRPFWKMGKNHVAHARIPWGFFLVDTGTIRDSKLLESLCLQFCLGSPYIWAILTRLWEINTKITLSWAHKQFATRVHRLLSIYHMLGKVRGWWGGYRRKLHTHSLTFNGTAAEVKEWMSDFIPHFMVHITTYPCWDWS